MKTAAALILAALVSACAPHEKPAATTSAASDKVYALRGKIVARDAGDNTLRVDHEEIKGFMEAMTMDYSVRGAKVGALPPDGTKVTAKLHVAGDAYWLTDVQNAR